MRVRWTWAERGIGREGATRIHITGRTCARRMLLKPSGGVTEHRVTVPRTRQYDMGCEGTCIRVLAIFEQFEVE